MSETAGGCDHHPTLLTELHGLGLVIWWQVDHWHICVKGCFGGVHHISLSGIFLTGNIRQGKSTVKLGLTNNLPDGNILGMAKIKLNVWGFRCERCEHEWVPRNEEEPRVCPKCKSPYWNRPRKSGKKTDANPSEKSVELTMTDETNGEN